MIRHRPPKGYEELNLKTTPHLGARADARYQSHIRHLRAGDRLFAFVHAPPTPSMLRPSRTKAEQDQWYQQIPPDLWQKAAEAHSIQAATELFSHRPSSLPKWPWSQLDLTILGVSLNGEAS